MQSGLQKIIRKIISTLNLQNNISRTQVSMSTCIIRLIFAVDLYRLISHLTTDTFLGGLFKVVKLSLNNIM